MPFYTKGNKLYNNKVRYNILPIDKNVISNHINSSTANRLVGKNPSTDRLVYSSQNPYGGVDDAGIWVRNPNCWINGVSNISCFSPAQRSGANWWQRGGTLITRKHVLFAKHFTTSVLPNGGTPLIFVDENNNAIRRNIISYAFGYSDVAIALLDQEVPSNIDIAKVLPINYNNYLNINSLLSIGLDQEEKAILVKMTGFQNYIVNDYSTNGTGQAVATQNVLLYTIMANDQDFGSYSDFSESIIVGDSGNPVFLIIDNELVVLTTWWFPTGGPFITQQYDKVNQVIEYLSPGEGYSLTPINLELVYHKYL
jgi:hypothetical protein